MTRIFPITPMAQARVKAAGGMKHAMYLIGRN